MEQSDSEAQAALFAMIVFGCLIFVAVTFIAPANGMPWLWAEIAGPLWLALCAITAWLVWRFRLPTSENVSYAAIFFGSIGLLGLLVFLYYEHRFLGPDRRGTSD